MERILCAPQARFFCYSVWFYGLLSGEMTQDWGSVTMERIPCAPQARKFLNIRDAFMDFLVWGNDSGLELGDNGKDTLRAAGAKIFDICVVSMDFLKAK